MLNELPGKVEVIEAIDSKTLSDLDIDKHYKRFIHCPPYPFKLRKSEIACFFSHRKVWELISKNSDSYSMVLEDDCAIDENCFSLALSKAKEFARNEQLIRFPVFRSEIPKSLKNSTSPQIFKTTSIALRAQCQIVGKKTALQLLNATEKFDRPVDTTIQLAWITKVHPVNIWPSGVMEMSQALNGSTISKNKTVLERVYREIARPIYRSAIAVYSQFLN